MKNWRVEAAVGKSQRYVKDSVVRKRTEQEAFSFSAPGMHSAHLLSRTDKKACQNIKRVTLFVLQGQIREHGPNPSVCDPHETMKNIQCPLYSPIVP